ncbi:hypothetical protein ABPG72_002226 [Tetrahymena utriculariae]
MGNQSCTEANPKNLLVFSDKKQKSKIVQLYIQIVGHEGSGKKYLKSFIYNEDKHSFYETIEKQQQKPYIQCFAQTKITFEECKEFDINKFEQNQFSSEFQYAVFIFNNESEESVKNLQIELKKAQEHSVKYKIILNNKCQEQNQQNLQEIQQIDLILDHGKYNDNKYNDNKQQVYQFFNDIYEAEDDEDTQSRTGILLSQNTTQKTINKKPL